MISLLECTHAEHLHLFLGEEAPVATAYILLGEAGELHTVEAYDAVAKALEDTAHDAVLATVYLDAHLTLVGLMGILDGIGLDLTVLKGDAFGNLIHVVCGDILVEEHMIYLLLEEFGVGKLAGKVAVVGEQQHTGGIAVETANRIDALRTGVFHQVHDSLALLGVITGGDIILGLVEQHIYLLFKAYGLVVEHHLIRTRHLRAQFGNHLSVDRHHTCLDEGICLTTAANTGIGKILIETDGLIGIDVLLLVLNTFLQVVLGVGVIARRMLTIATLLVTATLLVAATLLVTATLLVATLLTGLIATLLTGLIATLLTGLIATLLTGLVTTLLTGLVATGLISILLTGLITTTGLIATLLTRLITTLLTGLVATLLTVAHIIVVTRTILALSTTRLESCSKAFGTEAALIFVVSFTRISTLSVNAWAHHASSTVVL